MSGKYVVGYHAYSYSCQALNSLRGLCFCLHRLGNGIFWNAAYLGFQADPDSGVIHTLTSGGAAEQAGVRVGDRIRTLYDLPWQELLAQPSNITRIFSPHQTVSMTVERDGKILAFALNKTQRDADFQREKLGMLMLALACWVTGTVFGMRRDTASWSTLVSLFWLALSVVIGSYLFARYTFLLLHILLHIVVLVLAPLSLYAHTYYPRRLKDGAPRTQARRMLLWSYAALVVLLLFGVQRYGASLLAWQNTLSAVVWPTLIAAFIGNTVLLWHTYANESVEPVRRQIRLICYAYALCSVAFCGFYTLARISSSYLRITEPQLALLLGVVPLAYLVGYAVVDAYRFEQLLVWLLRHALAALIALCGVLTASRLVAWSGPSEPWLVIGFVVIYQAVSVALRFLIGLYKQPDVETILRSTAERLTTTLDQAQLLSIISEGLGQAFMQPPLALYMRESDDAPQLILRAVQHFTYLPDELKSPALLAALVATEGRVTTAAAFAQAWNIEASALEAQQFVRHPSLTLVCPVLDSQRVVLGLVALGLRPDLELYRTRDILHLQQMMNAVALALANCATYVRQCQAEATIRALYQRLQHAQDNVLRNVAIEIHDEVLNIGTRLNIQALEQLICDTHDSEMQQKLRKILETEQSVATTLRMLCEDIHPSGLHDPLGLVGVLRSQIERTQLIWNGTCRFRVDGAAIPVHSDVQREAVRIMREALTNAVKHASGVTIIDVELCYLAEPTARVRISVSDNGRTSAPLELKPQHWGIRNMIECARSVGGVIHMTQNATGGVLVECDLPTTPE